MLHYGSSSCPPGINSVASCRVKLKIENEPNNELGRSKFFPTKDTLKVYNTYDTCVHVVHTCTCSHTVQYDEASH